MVRGRRYRVRFDGLARGAAGIRPAVIMFTGTYDGVIAQIGTEGTRMATFRDNRFIDGADVGWEPPVYGVPVPAMIAVERADGSTT